ncbi:hypothetical protein N431DRAFT_425929 [Stipitochalara longipes BDJ]|nr:hypothetical protein N431DRAFT_425929 [Stipitochalara longipes BDJ]
MLAGLSEHGLILRCLMTSISYHSLLVISYFTWYFSERRYTAKHFKGNATGSTSTASGPGALDLPQVPRASDDVPSFSPRQLLFLQSLEVQTRGPIRQHDSDLVMAGHESGIASSHISSRQNPHHQQRRY